MDDWFRGVWTEVTADHLKANWCGGRKNERFRCNFCGHQFQTGDDFRCIFTNCKQYDDEGIPGGNPLVCIGCDPTTDSDRMRKLWKELHDEYDAFVSHPKFWSMKQVT